MFVGLFSVKGRHKWWRWWWHSLKMIQLICCTWNYTIFVYHTLMSVSSSHEHLHLSRLTLHASCSICIWPRWTIMADSRCPSSLCRNQPVNLSIYTTCTRQRLCSNWLDITALTPLFNVWGNVSEVWLVMSNWDIKLHLISAMPGSF